MFAQMIDTLRAKLASLKHPKLGSKKLAAEYQALGDESREQGEWDQARLHYEKALQIYQHNAQQGSTKTTPTSHSQGRSLFNRNEWAERCVFVRLAEACYMMGYAFFALGEYDEACRCYQKVLDVYPLRTPDEFQTSYTCYLYAEVLLLRNDMNMAQQLYEQALEIQQRINYNQESLHVANISARLCNIFYNVGQTDQAHQHFEKALAIVSEEPESFDVAFVYSYLAAYMHKQGNTVREQRYYQQAVTMGERLDFEDFQMVQLIVGLGLSLYDNGERASAPLQFEQVISMHEEEDRLKEKRPHFAALELFVVANAYFGKGRILDDEEQYSMQSLFYYQRALDIYNELGSERLKTFGSVNQRPWPTINVIQNRIALHPTRLLTMEHALLPFTWCHVFAEYGNDAQSIYYLLREQPHVVEVKGS